MTKQHDIVRHISIVAPATQCFDYIVPVPLPHIFRRNLFLPGVARTDETQHWLKPGLTRTVYFTDATEAREELLTVDPPDSFTYRITEFTGINRLLVSEIKGAWKFSGNGTSTDIAWTYSLMCRNFMTYAVARVFVAPLLRSYLDRALRILKQDLE